MAKYANWYKVNLSLGMDNADLANADAVLVAGHLPVCRDDQAGMGGRNSAAHGGHVCAGKGQHQHLDGDERQSGIRHQRGRGIESNAGGGGGCAARRGGQHADGDLDIRDHRHRRWVCGRGVDRAGRVLG